MDPFFRTLAERSSKERLSMLISLVDQVFVFRTRGMVSSGTDCWGYGPRPFVDAQTIQGAVS